MNWDQIAGQWGQGKEGMKRKWGKMTDDDLKVGGGSKDKQLGKIQGRHGDAKKKWKMD